MTDFVFCYAPWDDEQVVSLNDYQFAGLMHPFTCSNRGQLPHPADGGQGLLVAGPQGWSCADCDYRQDWAHSWMADGSWRRWQVQRDELLRSADRPS